MILILLCLLLHVLYYTPAIVDYADNTDDNNNNYNDTTYINNNYNNITYINHHQP